MFETRYWVWDSILSEELCDSIILESDKLLFGEGQIGGNVINGQNLIAHQDNKIRNTNISFFDPHHWIHGICLHYATTANFNAKWNFELSYPQNVQYAKYFPDQHYAPHSDDLIRKDCNEMRKLSVAIQLSNPNDYEGGDFIIENDIGEYELLQNFRKRGSVIVFPSVIKHGILPVVRGVRHSVVCWVVGPKFR
jgi:PKHD-type hydroxylase